MKRIIKIVIIGCMFLVTIFAATFVATDMYLKSKHNNEEQTSQTSTDASSKNKKILNQNVKVIFTRGDDREAEKTLEEVIDEYGLEGNVTEAELTSALAEYGYKLDLDSGKELYYSRTAKDSLVANKYYIGEYDGYLAIYKSDDKGKLKIEDQTKDVYTASRRFNDLKPVDQETIKNYKLVYDTKDMAKDAITDLIT